MSLWQEMSLNLWDSHFMFYKKIVKTTESEAFFLDASCGTRKTFLLNLLFAKVRQRNQITLAAESSGIAATPFRGGRTSHLHSNHL
jgi:uncharacterized protein YpiB (UPF0302 family)